MLCLPLRSVSLSTTHCRSFANMRLRGSANPLPRERTGPRLAFRGCGVDCDAERITGHRHSTREHLANIFLRKSAQQRLRDGAGFIVNGIGAKVGIVAIAGSAVVGRR